MPMDYSIGLGVVCHLRDSFILPLLSTLASNIIEEGNLDVRSRTHQISS